MIRPEPPGHAVGRGEGGRRGPRDPARSAGSRGVEGGWGVGKPRKKNHVIYERSLMVGSKKLECQRSHEEKLCRVIKPQSAMKATHRHPPSLFDHSVRPSRYASVVDRAQVTTLPQIRYTVILWVRVYG